MIKDTNKRLGVLLDPLSDNSQLIAEAINVARLDACTWLVICVDDEHYRLDSLSRERLRLSIDQAREAGAQITHIPSQNLLKNIIQKVEVNQLSYLIIGEAKKNSLLSFFQSSLADDLRRHNKSFQLQVVSLDQQVDVPVNPIKKGWWGYFVSMTLILILTLVIDFIQESLPEYKFNASIYNVSMIYLLAIVFSALRYGVWPAIVAAFMSFILYNYLFILPFYEFALDQFSDVLNFTLFLSASLVSVAFADAYKRKMTILRERELAARALQDLTKEIDDISDCEKNIQAMALNLQEILQSNVVVLLKNEDLISVFPETWQEDPSLALSSYHKQEIIHAEKWTYYPISTPRKSVGILGVAINSGFRNEKLIEALAYQVALAVERSELMMESQDIKLKHQRESLRNSLLSSVSHDLKTPLVSIIGSLSSIRHMDESLTRKQREELIGTAIEEAERLNQSITNILDMTKIESGYMKINKQWLSVHSLFSEAIARFSTQLGERNIIIDVPDNDLGIKVDAVLFPQVLQNILENISKYTAFDAEVKLDAILKDNKIELRISDNGPGVPDEQQERLFDKFTRLDNRDSRIAGTGLGLSICKAIVELNEGTIFLQNNMDSNGLLVVIRLDNYKIIEEIKV